MLENCDRTVIVLWNCLVPQVDVRVLYRKRGIVVPLFLLGKTIHPKQHAFASQRQHVLVKTSVGNLNVSAATQNERLIRFDARTEKLITDVWRTNLRAEYSLLFPCVGKHLIFGVRVIRSSLFVTLKPPYLEVVKCNYCLAGLSHVQMSSLTSNDGEPIGNTSN